MNCPDCGAAMEPVGNRKHLHCEHCGNFHFPEETGDGVSLLAEWAGLDCPVCSQALQKAQIEGEAVNYCDRCRGFLTTTVAFSRVVAKRRQTHGPHEQINDPFDPAELRRRLKCPQCHLFMETHPYYGGGNAVVDTCERCGFIWLDAGELAVLERYIPQAPRQEPAVIYVTNEVRRDPDRPELDVADVFFNIWGAL